MTRNKFVPALITLVFVLSTGIPAHAQKRGKLERQIDSLMAELRAKEAEFLSPSAKDVSAHAGFLSQPDTGLMRLMPRETYDGKLLTRGGGAYYSFTRLSNEYAFDVHIGLEQGNLKTGFYGANYGFVTLLGDVQLESVTFDHPGVQFLNSFAPPSLEPQAREQQRRTGTGFEAGGFVYKSYLPALVDNTYATRIINYGESDLLVAFRVVRQDSDGSLILLWKVLKKFATPELARASCLGRAEGYSFSAVPERHLSFRGKSSLSRFAN
jgi:hypothetical protein